MHASQAFAFDVFLTHHDKSIPQVQRLGERLRAAGLRVWLDATNQSFHDRRLSRRRGMGISRTLVLCLPVVLGHEWNTLIEDARAFRDPDDAGRRLVLVLLADGDIPEGLRGSRCIDYRQEPQPAFEEILAACRVTAEGSLQEPIVEGVLQAVRENVLKARYWVNSAAVSPDSRWLAVPGGNEVWISDLRSGSRSGTLDWHEGDGGGVCFTSDGKRIVTGTRDGLIRVWDMKTLQRVWRLKGHTSRVTEIAALSHARRVLSCSWDCTLRLWDVGRGECLKTIEGSDSDPFCVAVARDDRLAVTGQRNGKIKLWDLAAGTCIATLEGHRDWVGSVKFTPDGRWVISGSTDHTCKIWNVETGACEETLEDHKSSVSSVAAHPGGRLIATTGLSDLTACLWDLGTRKCDLVIHEDGDFSTSCVAFTPDGRRLIVGTTNAELHVYQLAGVAAGQTTFDLSPAALEELDSQALEQILVGHIMAICGEANQIFRELNRFDFGIDGEIEFKNRNGLPSGRKIYTQLKSGASYLRTRKSDGQEIFDVKNPRHLEYWTSQPVDVYLVIRDAQETIRWMNLTRYLRTRAEKDSRQIVFDGEELDASAVWRVRDELLKPS